MYGVDDDEAKNMQQEYNFGGMDPSSVSNRPASTTTFNANPEEVHVTLAPLAAESDNDYSPRNEDSGYPASPYAFVSADAPDTVPAAQASFTKTKASKKKDKKKAKDAAKEDQTFVDRVTGKNKGDVSLDTRWKNALKEEKRLDTMEQDLAERRANPTSTSAEPEPNFPRKFLCIRPLVYHSLSAVPPERRLFVTMAFWDWVAVCILLVANMVIMIITVAGKTVENPKYKDTNKPLTIVLSIVYMILGIPLGFLLWYWRIYRALSTGSPAQYIAALCGLIIALAQSIFSLVGPYKLGVCGAIFTKWANGNRAIGYVIVTGIMTGLWGLQTLFEFYLIVRCFIYYRKDLGARRRAKYEAEQQAVIG